MHLWIALAVRYLGFLMFYCYAVIKLNISAGAVYCSRYPGFLFFHCFAAVKSMNYYSGSWALM